MKQDNVALGAPRYSYVMYVCTMYTKENHNYQNLIPFTEKQLQIDYKAAINEIHISPNGKKSRCVSVTLLHNKTSHCSAGCTEGSQLLRFKVQTAAFFFL